jgi:hypothetical protein
MNSVPEPQNSGGHLGSLDGSGAGDHDQPYRFGFRPRASVPYPFSTRQYARLLVFRGRVQNHMANEGEHCVGCADDAAWRPEAA